MSINPKNTYLDFQDLNIFNQIIERDLESTDDLDLRLCILADKHLRQKQYLSACQEIGQLTNMAMKKFYAIELMDNLMASNEEQANVIARSMAPGDLKDKYLAELGRHYINNQNVSAAELVVTSMRDGLLKTNLLLDINALHIVEDKKKIKLLIQSWTKPETIHFKLADEDISNIKSSSSQDDLRAKLGEILMRNGKSSEALSIIEKISDPIKKDEARANLVEIAMDDNELQKALFFLNLITNPITCFNVNKKREELLAQIAMDA